MAPSFILRRGARIASTLAIILLSATIGLSVASRAPGLDRYSRDWLMRTRGVLAPPSDIAIVAIDEHSIQQFGRFPWSRSVIARTIDRLAQSQARVIALDVLVTDRSKADDDLALANAISRAGNVVVAAELTDSAMGASSGKWLEPLPEIGHAAASVGHVNVQTESEGVAHEVLVRAADDSGRVLRAMSVEAVRVGDGTAEQAISDTPNAILLGRRVIPVRIASPNLVLNTTETPGQTAQVFRGARMAIDYIGPAGSFAPYAYSLSEVLNGRVPASRFKDRYVLIGATAASLGDRLSSPFLHHADVTSDEHGSLMPGVEVLANAVNTILRSRFYSEIPDWESFLWAAGVAAATLALLDLSQGSLESLKQTLVLIGMGCAILWSCYVVFVHLLIIPPIVPIWCAFTSAAVFGMLQRSLITSSQLDSTIADLTSAGDLLKSSETKVDIAGSIGRLLEAPAIAIFCTTPSGKYVLTGSYGLPLAPQYESRGALRISFEASLLKSLFVLPLDAVSVYEAASVAMPGGAHAGHVVVLHRKENPPSSEALRVAAAIAASSNSMGSQGTRRGFGANWWPDRLASKAASLDALNARLVESSRFIDLAMRSVEDGLIITGPDGVIRFCNPTSASMLHSTESALIGSNLLDRLAECDGNRSAKKEGSSTRTELLARLLLDRSSIEREITFPGARLERYVVRLAAVSGGEAAGTVVGIVASLSDITREHELQQTKNDVIALVSHEMRTPLTAVQGMSELLAQYDVEPGRRREMSLAINDEVKRLTRMITQYLDITRLESGATVLRLSHFRIETVLERTLLLLDPIAGSRKVRLMRSLEPDLPAMLADPDLIARALENLVSNAIKYSPSGTEVRVDVYRQSGNLLIDVRDQGYGISTAELNKIFEKFYRIPRAQDANVPGTGLGLALVREIVQLHGGTVSVDSSVGSGSTFTLRIPQRDP